MKSKSHPMRVLNGEETSLRLFTDEPSAPAPSAALTTTPPATESIPPLISLTQISAEWPPLLKRLGRRRRVLETILAVGRPIRLINHTLVVGFPPHRRFHQELLDLPDYRACVEEELARTFRMPLSVVTALHPESHGLSRRGAFGKTPA